MEAPAPRASSGGEGLGTLARQTATVCAVAGLFVFFALGVADAIDIFLMIFLGLLLAILLHSLAEVVDRWAHLGSKASLAAVLVLLLLLAGVCGWLLFPILTSQFAELQRQWPDSVNHLRRELGASAWGEWILGQVDQAQRQMLERKVLWSRTAGVVTSVIGVAGVLVVVLFVGLLLAAQPEVYTHGLLALTPPRRRARVREVLAELASTLRGWLLAKLVAMALIGVLTWLGLLWLNIEFAVTLAVLAALLTFVPNFGPILSALPAMLLGLMQSPLTVLWVGLLYVAIQTVESYLITPLIQYRALSLPPVLVIAAQLAASAWMGVLGLVIATPMLAAAVVLVRMLYQEDVLHERTSDSSGVAGEP